MVIIMVVLTILLFLSIDYFVQRKKQRLQAKINSTKTVPLFKAIRDLPKGVFVQPSFTWSKLLDNGSLALGLHPMLIALIGEPDEMEVMAEGEHINKGDNLINIRRNGRNLWVKSPVSGQITTVNSSLTSAATVDRLNREYLFIIRPQDVSEEIKSWLIAQNAATWTRKRINEVREFIAGKIMHPELGVTLADGGELPVGILSQLDEDIWQEFENVFLKLN